MKSYIFFTMNDFSKDDGGTLRMKGILNAFKDNEKVILISNTQNKKEFNSNIVHININMIFNKKDKKIFQLLLAVLPFFIFRFFYLKFFANLDKVFSDLNINSNIIFFEYLDNSIGYSLKKAGIIKSYINDTHGIAPLEFENKISNNLKSKIYNYISKIVVEKLDHKVFSNLDKLIVVSNQMKKYLTDKYPFLNNKTIEVIRDGVNTSICTQVVDDNIRANLYHDYPTLKNKKIILFIGSFKDLGGVVDLVNAYIKINMFDKYKLLLIGSGEKKTEIEKLIKKHDLKESIILFGRIQYSNIKSYQNVGDVIVCPDKKHPYSEIVPHVKYFDSLASGKVVINGSFKSTQEINEKEKLSIDFEPSNVTDLANKIKYVLENQQTLEKKYSESAKYTCDYLNYNFYIQNSNLFKDYL